MRAVRNLILGYVAIIAVFGAPAGAAETGAPLRILGLGDSLMHGFGLPSGSEFPVKLEQALRAKGFNVSVVNAGVSGDTSAGGLARIDWSLAEKPDAVIIEFGGNDALRGLPPAEMEKNLDGMITKAKAAGLPVLLAGMMAPRNLGPHYAAEFDAVFPRLAEKHDVLFYPFFLDGVATDPALNQADRIHPNAKGVDVIVERILPLATELVAQARDRRSAAQ